jgi:[ribosomal protein S18]-alanine N-acetyltransferase
MNSRVSQPGSSRCNLQTAQNGYNVRPAIVEDLGEIMTIENTSFAEPWPAPSMVNEIVNRSWSRVVVITDDRQIIGFMVYWAVATELHLLNFAVKTNHRERGIGRMMINHLVEVATEENRTGIALEVRASNQQAQNLYRSIGFEQICVHAEYYTDNGEDALVMWLTIDEDTARPS